MTFKGCPDVEDSFFAQNVWNMYLNVWNDLNLWDQLVYLYLKKEPTTMRHCMVENQQKYG